MLTGSPGKGTAGTEPTPPKEQQADPRVHAHGRCLLLLPDAPRPQLAPPALLADSLGTAWFLQASGENQMPPGEGKGGSLI